jgi:hypothetical protein
MSYGDESVEVAEIAGLSPATVPVRLAGRGSVIPTISSGGNTYTYRTKVGFGVTSSRPLLRHEQSTHEHDGTSWIELLPADELDVFADELNAAVQSLKTGTSPRRLAELLTEWRATAEIYGDPELFEVLSEETTEDLGPVPDPRV